MYIAVEHLYSLVYYYSQLYILDCGLKKNERAKIWLEKARNLGDAKIRQKNTLQKRLGSLLNIGCKKTCDNPVLFIKDPDKTRSENIICLNRRPPITDGHQRVQKPPHSGLLLKKDFTDC